MDVERKGEWTVEWKGEWTIEWKGEWTVEWKGKLSNGRASCRMDGRVDRGTDMMGCGRGDVAWSTTHGQRSENAERCRGVARTRSRGRKNMKKCI